MFFIRIKSAQVLSIDRILISLSPEHKTQKNLELSPNRSDYRDVSIENCHSISPDVIVCYGSRGKTTVFTSKVNRDTYNHCRPIEWHGQPSVTCQGEQTTFIHTPYNRNSTAAHLFNAVDGWLILAQATPGIYHELIKFAIYLIFLRCDGCKDRSNRRSWSSPILTSNRPACAPDCRMSVEHWDQLSSTLK